MNDAYYDIECRIKIEGIKIGIDLAIPLGLIINELVTNAFKYAFSNGNGPEKGGEQWVEIAMYRLHRQIVLTVSDNGRGYPHDFDPEQSSTLGFQLIGALINQINGRLEIDKEGSVCTISFPDTA
jgi:two-component sensor histidine kinase